MNTKPKGVFLSRVFPVILLGLLLLFPNISLQGASGGLLLWFHVVLPTLAPFMICTQMVVALDGVGLLTRPFAPILKRLFRLSPQGIYVMLCGLLCGYPLGAKLCADFVHSKTITRQEGANLLSICNHPSPMFLVGYVITQLKGSVSPLCLLLSLYLPIIPVSWLSRKYNCRQEPKLCICSYEDAPRKTSLDSVLLSTCETMVLIGGYMMLFSIVSQWILQLPFLSPKTAALLAGAAEITTGIHQITLVFPSEQALVPAVAAVAFGGLSGIFQTKSVIKKAGYSIRPYVFWKIIHAGCSCLTLILLKQLLPLLWH